MITVLQPLDSPMHPDSLHNPFAILNLPLQFDLAPATLEAAYLQRVAAAHPDTAADLAADSDDVSIEALNQAKAALLDDETRANLLLTLLGGPDKSADQSLPEGFLMDIMQTRQQIESDLASGDPGARAKWEGWAESQRAGTLQRLAPMFAQAESDAAVRGAIRTELNAWRYLERLLEQLDPDYNPAQADFNG